MVYGERVGGAVSRHDRHPDLADQAVLRQQIEEQLEQAAVRGPVHGRPGDDDPRACRRLERTRELGVRSPAEQRLRRERGEVNQLGHGAARREAGQGVFHQEARLGRSGRAAGDPHRDQVRGQSLTLPRSGPAPDLLGLVQETLQRERLDEEMFRLGEQPRALLAGARFRADQHEPAAQLRPDLQRVLPQPQPPALRHVHIRDDGVEPLGPDGL